MGWVSKEIKDYLYLKLTGQAKTIFREREFLPERSFAQHRGILLHF